MIENLSLVVMNPSVLMAIAGILVIVALIPLGAMGWTKLCHRKLRKEDIENNSYKK